MTGLLNTVILLGAIQGLIVSGLLLRRNINRQADRLLAALLLLMSLASFNLYFYNTRVFESSAVLRTIASVVPMVIVMPMGPLIYFYIRSGTDPFFRLTRRHRLQFYSAILDIVPELSTLIFIAGVPLHLFTDDRGPLDRFIGYYNMYADIPRWISLTVYVLLSWRYIKKMRDPDPEAEKKIAGLKWLRQFITVFLAFQLVWFLYLVPYVIPATSDWLLDHLGWYPIYIPLAIMIYWLGIKGYLLSFPAVAGKKKTPALPDPVVEETKAALKKAMEEDRLYINPRLTVVMVADHTGIPAKTISAVLNQHVGQGFAEWVNHYRLQAFRQAIRQADLEQLTIAAVAASCGFSSQATFQRIFKQSTGMTPSEYLKSRK